MAMKHIRLDLRTVSEPTRDRPNNHAAVSSLPQAKATAVHPTGAGGENARIFFVGTATTILCVVIHAYDVGLDGRAANLQRQVNGTACA